MFITDTDTGTTGNDTGNDNTMSAFDAELKAIMDNDPDFADFNDDDDDTNDNGDDNGDDNVNDKGKNPDTENLDTDSENADSDDKDKKTDKTETPEDDIVGIEPPKSWSKEQHDLFKKLPPEAQQQIVKREQDVIQGIQKIYDKINPQINFAENIQNLLKPYEAEMRQLGDETGGINTLASFLEPARILNFGTPQEKAEMLLSVASTHGVDLIGFLKGIPPEAQQQRQIQNLEVLQLKQQINELTNLEKMRQIEADKQLEAEVVNEITEIQNDKENYPYLNDVIKEMHNLVTSGLAETLKEAYQKAVLLNPATQEKIIAQQAEKLKSNQIQQNQQRVNKARQNAISPKSGTGFGFSNVPLDEDEFDALQIKKLQEAGY